MSAALYVGIDVSRDTLAIAFHPRNTLWCEPNRDFEELIERLGRLNPKLIVLESSGGYEQGVFKALQQAGLPVYLENAVHIFYFRRSLGRIVKTDHTDAQVIADYAARESHRLEVSPAVLESVNLLRALWLRRMQLQKLQRMEKNHRRAPHIGPSHRASCNRVLEGVELELAEVERQLEEVVASDEKLRQKAIWLQSIPGIGLVTAAGLLALLPELGTGHRKGVSALCGLVPHERSSGKFKGKASIQSGRSSLRLLMYMPTLSATKCNPAIRVVYERLVAQGKPKKVALTACMHKMVRIAHAVIKHQTGWLASA